MEADHGGGEVLEVDGEGGLDGTAAHHQRLGLQHALHHAEGVVHGALHLVAVEVVRAAQDDGGGRPRRRTAAEGNSPHNRANEKINTAAVTSACRRDVEFRK